MEEDRVFVAVKRDHRESKSTLVWALKNNASAKKFVLVHVFSPAQMIPLMGGKFPAEQLHKDHVAAYRKIERQKLDKDLSKYILMSKGLECEIELLVVEMDNIATGILETIKEHGVTKLVMGAAADKHYTKKLKLIRSSTACTVLKEAPSFCNMWFICKGNFICSSDDFMDEYGVPGSQMGSTGNRSPETKYSVSEFSSQAGSPGNRSPEIRHSASELSSQSSQRSDNTNDFANRISIPYSNTHTPKSLSSLLSGDSPVTKNQDPSLWPERSRKSVSLDSSAHVQRKNDGVVFEMLHMSEEDDLKVDDVYGKLHQALLEIEKLKDEAHKESLTHRRKAENELLDANYRARIAESNYGKEKKLREDIEKDLAQEKFELEKLKCQLNGGKQLQNSPVQSTDSGRVLKDYEASLSALQLLVSSLQEERQTLQKERDGFRKERDTAIKEVEELKKSSQGNCSCKTPEVLEFSYSELEQATGNFDDSHKIGESRYGKVYKGSLEGTTVAIKMLQSNTMLSQPEFHQEVESLSKLKHPNLINIIGTCSEERVIIHEFLNTTLEDHLSCKDERPPLPSHSRIRICIEICSALVCLHSHQPESIIYGDLRPINILLDDNLVSKITDFGFNRLVPCTALTVFRCSDPKEMFTYMDPEFFSTGTLTANSDTYSFGIIILRLMTGLPAIGIVKEVHYAVESRKLNGILDPDAGEWDTVKAEQLVQLGLQCCEMSRKSRPDIITDVWSILQTMKN